MRMACGLQNKKGDEDAVRPWLTGYIQCLVASGNVCLEISQDNVSQKDD